MQNNLQQIDLIDNRVLPTKTNVSAVAVGIIQSVADGIADPFETVVRVEAIKKICEEVKDGLKAVIRDELDKYQGKAVGKLSAKIEAAEVGTKYDFSGDPVWAAIQSRIEPLLEEKKNREAFLKTLKKTMIETDADTGETFEVPPPVKTSESSFKISLAK